jgi:hypothetical protein
MNIKMIPTIKGFIDINLTHAWLSPVIRFTGQCPEPKRMPWRLSPETFFPLSVTIRRSVSRRWA